MPITAFVGFPRAVGATNAARVTAFFSGPRLLLTLTRPLVASCRSSSSRRALVNRRTDVKLSRASRRLLATTPSTLPPSPPTPRNNKPPGDEEDAKDVQELHESPYTLPNALTIARIAACPFLAWSIVQGDFKLATGILVVSGLTDWVDGYLARRWNQKTVLGSILDPMADKTLVTTLVVCLTYKGLLPLPLALLIFGRDFALSMWAFYLRFKSLPPPRTLKRYFDPTMPSAEVKPTQISKVNTALQLGLMGLTTVSPLLTAFPLVASGLQGLQWIVAGTTIWSGLSYVGTAGFKILKQPAKRP